MNPSRSITPEWFDAVLFDLDGVVTATAKVHTACWKRTFDEFLRHQAAAFVPFDPIADYLRYVDGKARYEGAQSFLTARGLSLPYGAPDDPPDRQTVCGLGNRKNALIQMVIASEGVETYPDALSLLRAVRARGLKTSVVSSSRNCPMILEAAGIADLFEVRFDGQLAAELKLKGKPAPDTFLAAACQLAVQPPRAVVIEDALVGVEAGRAGGFGLVVGVMRGRQTGHADALRERGADIVVSDLKDLIAHG